MTDHQGSEPRPPIPADIRRRVLVEAGHRCAIPTCRYIETELHHIEPWAKCKKHEYENIIAICANCHRRADRGEIDRKSLRLYKFNLRFAHDKFSQLEMDLLFDASKLSDGQALLWPPIMNILIRRILEAGYVNLRERDGMLTIVGGLDQTPRLLTLSKKGRDFLDEIGVHEF